VTEEQAAGIVDYNSDVGYYESYGAKPVHHKNGIYSQHAGFLDAFESLESAILAEGHYLDKNPVPPFNERLNDWIEAQSRVLSRDRCLLLRRVE